MKLVDDIVTYVTTNIIITSLLNGDTWLQEFKKYQN